MKRVFRLATFALCLSTLNLFAATKVWTGLSSDLPPRWDDAANWDSGVPGEFDDVVIGEPPYSTPAHITVSGPIKVKGLSMNRTTLIGPAQLEVQTLTSKGASLTEGGTLKITVGGTITTGSGGEYGLFIDGWTITNNGSFTITDGTTMKFYVSVGSFINNGTVDLADGAIVDGLGVNDSEFLNLNIVRKTQGPGKSTFNALKFTNRRELRVSAGSVNFPVGQVANGGGVMTIQNADSSIVFEGASVALNGGVLAGVGPYIARGNTVITVNVDMPMDILSLACDLTGPAKLTVRKSLNWTSGTLSGSGELVLGPNGFVGSSLTIGDPTGGGVHKIVGRTLRNQGTATWISGDISITEGGKFINDNGGQLTVSDLVDKQISADSSDAGFFNELGSVDFAKENGRKVSIYCPFNNSGYVQFESQVLLYGGGVQSGGWKVTGPDGLVAVASGTLYLDDFFTATGPVSIIGGVVYARSIAASADKIDLSGGAIDGPGYLAVENFTWDGGVIRGSGALQVNSFDWGLPVGLRELSQRTIILTGVGNWNGVNFTAGDGAILRIYGELRAGPAEAIQYGSRTVATVQNYGLVTKNSGTGTTYFDANFVNKGGRVVVGQGKMEFARGLTQENGDILVEALAEAQIDGGLVNMATGRLMGAGKFSGGVMNSGILSPGKSPGLLTIVNTLTQTDTSRLVIELGGRAAGTEYDQVNVAGDATLAGTLEIKLINGFTPVTGDRFDVMAFGSRTGQFKTIVGDLQNNTEFTVQYLATGVAIVAKQVGGTTLNLVSTAPNRATTWGWTSAPGQQTQIEYSSDLLAWTAFTNLTATSSTMQFELPLPAPGEAARFYRLR